MPLVTVVLVVMVEISNIGAVMGIRGGVVEECAWREDSLVII